MKRLLIANRGEIAIRVARTARELGIETVAVYSSADREARHVSAGDVAVEIGPAPAVDSYLNAGKIIDAARKTNADAIHPGYGFLSEDPEFAEAVEAAGIRWVGPPPSAMRAMGAKIAARARMIAAGVPVVPGFPGSPDPKEMGEGAAALGYPVLVKASAGGGGKGMRLVARAEELPSAIEGARREALSAFGDGAVYLEKAISRPRHVEMQIFGDRAGRVVALGERECSIQRRHQKIVEEAPSPSLDAGVRAAMAEAAVAAGRAVGYASAGTVEFLLDESRKFYFLEMNTRLQVEHAVTEETLGIDLVRAQLEVADGHPLSEGWGALEPRGHAIECRVYAEDPETHLPRSGTVLAYEEPCGPGVRVDAGIERGSRVGIDYDPILAKVIVRAESRGAAIARMREALSRYVILGVTTNIPLLRRIVASEDFGAGRTDTGFVERLPPPPDSPPPAAAVLAALHEAGGARTGSVSSVLPGAADPWRAASSWRNR